MNKEKSKVVGVTLDESLYEELCKLAERERRPLANAARVVIRRYFEIAEIVDSYRLMNAVFQSQSQK